MITNRPFNNLDDLEKMKELASQKGVLADLQPGDLVWRFYRSPDISPEEDIMLWENESGELIAFAWYSPPDSFDFVVNESAQVEELGKDILNWCQKRYIDLKNEKPDSRPSDLLWTGSVETDTKRISLLKEFDFEEGEKYFSHMVFYSKDEFYPVEIPEGLSIHPVEKQIEIGEKVTAYRETFYPTDFSFESYLQLRESKDYIKDLDLVIVNKEGNIGAFGTAWYDTINQSGEIEPIGIRPGFKEVGLEKILISHLLHKLLKLGCKWIIAYPGSEDKELIEAYSELGFKTVAKNRDFFMRFII